MKIFSDVLSRGRKSVDDERRKIKLNSKLIKFKFFEKQNIESERTVTRTRYEGIDCSACYQNLEESLKFRFNQLRSFGRQSKRIDNKKLTIGKHINITYM